MHKKISKAVKAADKTTKAAIDKVAHAKELKRIRDAKYRAAKKAAKAKQAKADKAQPKTKQANGQHTADCGMSGFYIGILCSAVLGQGMALRAVADDKNAPSKVRDMCYAGWKLGQSALRVCCNGKEVR